MGTYVFCSAVFGILFFVMMFIPVRTIRSFKSSLLASLGIFACFTLFNCLAMPVISFDTIAIYVEYLAIAILILLYSGIVNEEWSKVNIGFLISVVVVMLVMGCISTPMFHAGDFRDQLNIEVQDSTAFDENIHQIPLTKMNRVSEETARDLIEKHKMGELSQKCELGKFTAQVITADFKINEFGSDEEIHFIFKEQPIWVAPLEHSSSWKAFRNGVTNGYALVFQNDPSKYFLVNKVNGKELQLQYLESGVLFSDLERHLRINGVDGLMDDFGIEINEHGLPFNTVSLLKNNIGWSAPKVTGMAIVDVQSGEITQTGIEDAPAFVNRIYPERIIKNHISWWGEYVHGWINLTDKDRKKATEEDLEVVYSNGDNYYYTGIKSWNSKGSTLGMMFTNTRTGQAFYYERTGINENDAEHAIASHDLVRDGIRLNTLSLNDALFYNIEGIPTYFSTVIATNDIMPKYYGFCSALNKQIVGVAPSLEEAVAEYMKKYLEVQSQSQSDIPSEANLVEQTFTVSEKVQEGNMYIFRFKETGTQQFYAFSDILNDVRWKAAKVRVKYNAESSQKMILMSGFEIIE